ncbi:MAG: GNAT family N-acetyltransferase [Acidobacteria bacterium]|nr:GNAT family N-acetyltransferase [Acidobacteriota bacterium]
MTEVSFRDAREEDIAPACDVFFASLHDMYARNNIDKPVAPRATVESSWLHVLRTGIFKLAEAEGRAVAVCNAVVRDRLWFLSGFWMLPEFQGRGAGGRLLREVWGEGAERGADVFFVWSSIDRTAMASYMRMGMLPGHQILTFAGRPDLTPGPRGDYGVEPLALETAHRLDAEVRATRRELDHDFWRAQPAMRHRQVVRQGRAVGYFYFTGGPESVVGPAAWDAGADAAGVLALAAREATAEGAETVTLRAPGVNHNAIRFALAAGMRFTGYSHFFTTAPFGRMEHYVPSGPMLY